MRDPQKAHEGIPDVSVVITAHREGVIAGATLRSALSSIEHLRVTSGKTSEVLIVLDHTDALTRSVFAGASTSNMRIIETDLADPGQARNVGALNAAGKYIAFLDGDDLWSYNWLAEAHRLIEGRPDAVAHSNCNIIFGRERNIWWHIDSEGPLFDPKYLEWANYWDAMAFALTEVYRRFPFRANNLALGFAHEDWHWNMMTIAAGIQHKPAPSTVHFKRRRAGSVSAIVNERHGTVWPLEVRQPSRNRAYPSR